MAKRTGAVKASLAAFTVPKYQSLVVRFGSKQEIVNRYRLYLFTHRMPALLRRHDCILAASEISDLYHFPHPETTETENIVKSLSRTLPAPLSLKQGTHFDVVLGSNMHHGAETDIGLTIPCLLYTSSGGCERCHREEPCRRKNGLPCARGGRRDQTWKILT